MTLDLKEGDPWPFRSSRGIVGKPCEPVWHALITAPQKEAHTKEVLERVFDGAGVQVVYPEVSKFRKVNGQDREFVSPMIARIIYAKFSYEPHWDVMRQRRIVSGVFSIADKPVRLAQDDVDQAMGLPTEQERQELERIRAIMPCAGEPAKLIGGPFKGFFVDVKKVEAGRVWYEMAFGDRRVSGEDTQGLVQRVAG
ncbi:transcription termination/antitermination protein NusG [Phaeobacter inhibens]|uniref:transcription termination/antitermination protein NusG n=1 Tax=Phaeobacter inhibens TaxID=221822 RepID=UPI000C9A9A63|nr:transcription termination/antitermination NusG family protein [Phaeobacter inhibens]AUQ64425.1 Transcription antiterminator [Phaeobacter inhibens]